MKTTKKTLTIRDLRAAAAVLLLGTYSALASVIDTIPGPGDFKTPQPRNTFVGRVEKSDLMVGLVLDDTEYAAYISDGRNIGEWITGKLQSGRISVVTAIGTELKAELSANIIGTVSTLSPAGSGSFSLTQVEPGRTGLFRSSNILKEAMQVRGVILARDGARGMTVRSGAKDVVVGGEVSTDTSDDRLDNGDGVKIVDDTLRLPKDAPNAHDYWENRLPGETMQDLACQYHSALEEYLEAKIYGLEQTLQGVSLLDSTEEEREDMEMLENLYDLLPSVKDKVDRDCFGIVYGDGAR